MARGPYNIPRNYKGESKILYIFSVKAIFFTAIALIIGFIFYYIFNLIGFVKIGIGIMIIFCLLGFSIATFKVPDSNKFDFTVKNGGENIDVIILRWIKFKLKKNKVYIYKDVKTKEEDF